MENKQKSIILLNHKAIPKVLSTTFRLSSLFQRISPNSSRKVIRQREYRASPVVEKRGVGEILPLFSFFFVVLKEEK